ncbi:alpha/beta fold hydrolase [Shewanella sp. NIFS-20-20]|uniref:alpha/beta fold hydrolase n=1 Tax=Shewanella sp. NIFS-20-20 TaxID=2853806 RepID=UPI001C48DD29|nr:alpha/beta hydrolase [Shewanella sp. NIFS-20-20]MBV7314993.1 alpha/beta hydrolase [Shewanella sp. NIFS-20-20]
MTVILLPGLDGTGLLLKQLYHQLNQSMAVKLYTLDNVAGTSYIEQAATIAQEITSEPVILVAESYSGRIAYELCQLRPMQVQAVVFIASFISSPSQLSRLAHWLPISLMRPNPVSSWLLHWLAFNLIGKRTRVEPIWHALSQANPLMLHHRLSNIAALKVPHAVIDCPAIYIKPHRDKLVSHTALALLKAVFANCTVINIAGGHFIAQTHPNECADIILNLVSTASHVHENEPLNVHDSR